MRSIEEIRLERHKMLETKFQDMVQLIEEKLISHGQVKVMYNQEDWSRCSDTDIDCSRRDYTKLKDCFLDAGYIIVDLKTNTKFLIKVA